MNIETLIKKGTNYNISQEYLDSKERGRIEFVSKFPLDKIFELTLDDYVLGTDKESFCYWLEFKKIEEKVIVFGIGGGNASKFGLYKSKDGLYQIGYGENKKALQGKDLDDYFNSIKYVIVNACKCVDEDRVENIKQMKIPFGNMVLLKILSIYYPSKFITIGSSNALIDLAKDIKLQNIGLNANNLIEINYQCKKAIDKIPEFKNWSYEKTGTFIWENYRPIEEKKSSDLKIKYWIYAPGENAIKWDEFYNSGIMALGWDEIGDLNQYNSRNEIKISLVNKYGGEGSKMNDVSANDDFINKINIGDVVIVKKGRSELLGYGLVTSAYFFDINRNDYRSCRKVDWKLKGNWKLNFSLVLKTLTNITMYSSTLPEYSTYYNQLLGIMTHAKPDINSLINYPLNTILYGPPGTGKTYNTILRAAEIVENRKIDSYHEAMKIFNENLHNRIEFITFHQNYSYEDFIQGLRPETDNKSSLTFDKKDGVFKKIAEKALQNIKLSEKAPEELSNEALFDNALEKFKEVVEENDANYPINETAYIMEVEEDAFRYTGEKWTNHANGLRMKFSDLKEFYNNGVKSRKDVKYLSNISGLAGQHATYYFLVYEKIIKHLPKKIDAPLKVERKNYVIVIDEINRANISRVFGELITLIEPDKRSHGEVPLEVKLPSGDYFIVPSNLYIIGTMNTADKSIALLDIALRRRFEFESMYPLYEIKGSEIYDKDILFKINEQIIKSKGHDFQIGHAYFMGENKDLIHRMNKKVIPLLLEYFMNDEKEVKGILYNAGLQVEENSWPIKIKGKRA
jgi:5-methylcytosine-specific restriction protein B